MGGIYKMKIKIETTNLNFRWEVSDESLNVIKPLLDLIGEPESIKVKLTFWERVKIFFLKLVKRDMKVVIAPEEDEPLGIG